MSQKLPPLRGGSSVADALQAKREVFAKQNLKVRDRESISVARYNEALEVFDLLQERGGKLKVVHSRSATTTNPTSTSSSIVRYLFPEEALYLLERGSLCVVTQVVVDDVGLEEGSVVSSDQTLWQVVLDDVGLDAYLAYAKLRRAGHVVQRRVASPEANMVASSPLMILGGKAAKARSVASHASHASEGKSKSRRTTVAEDESVHDGEEAKRRRLLKSTVAEDAEDESDANNAAFLVVEGRASYYGRGPRRDAAQLWEIRQAGRPPRDATPRNGTCEAREKAIAGAQDTVSALCCLDAAAAFGREIDLVRESSAVATARLGKDTTLGSAKIVISCEGETTFLEGNPVEI